MLQAGKLKDRITIQRPGTAQDAAGQPVIGWVDVDTVWANIAHKSGLETIKGAAPVSMVQASIRIRYRDDVDAGMRAVCGGVVYDIKAAPPNTGREYLDLVCEIAK